MAKDKIAKQDMVKVGDVYGELTVIERDYEREELDRLKKRYKKYFKCKCSCGKETTVLAYQLLNGKTKSCGHLQRDIAGSKPKDLCGKTINNLKVLYRDETKPTGSGKHTYWICKCEKCGKEKSIRSSDLIDGSAIDCGCESFKRFKSRNLNDFTGKTIGHLHVLNRDWNGKRGGFHARWDCQYDLCGRIESVSSNSLMAYGKDRCTICQGLSSGEMKILEIMQENGISFEHDKSFNDLRNPKTNSLLRFDFRITQNSDCDYIIEYDGEQHFKEVPLYDDNDSFEQRQFRDNFKNQWCKDHNIPLIRIPFTRLNKICYDDLKPETSKYLLK